MARDRPIGSARLRQGGRPAFAEKNEAGTGARRDRQDRMASGCAVRARLLSQQRIKEGEYAIRRARLSRKRFRDKAARLQTCMTAGGQAG